MLNNEQRDNRTIKRIYLDTNHWIRLLRVKNEKEENIELRHLYTTLKDLVLNNKIHIPFSTFTLHDISKRCNESKYREFIDFVLDVSQMYVLKPYSVFYKLEIENALTYVMEGRYVHDIYNKILGKGLDVYNMSSENLRCSDHLTPTEFAKYKTIKGVWQTLIHNREFVERALKDPGLAAVGRQSRQDSAALIDAVEQQRRKNSNISRSIFAKYYKARHLIGWEQYVVPLMISKNIRPKEIFSTIENAELFAKHLNSLNVVSLLYYERDIGCEKTLTYNDVQDIRHLAGSVPYCDITVTDKMFANLCYRIKLDRMYNCHILSSLEELAVYLDQNFS